MKKFFTLLVIAIFTITSSAQISTGEPHSTVVERTGNRPDKGTWGLYMGASAGQIIDIVNSLENDKIWYGLPMINLKYYYSDNLELRLGMQFAVETSSIKEKIYDEDIDEYGRIKDKDSYNFTRFRPGIAYHFNKTNILDVYLGAELPIGWNTSTTKNEYIDASKRSTYKGTFVVGAGVFFGFQVFVADLPFAIGLETGFSGLINYGGNTKYKVVDTDGIESVYYNNNPTIYDASRVSANWNADAAITFSYFFK
jgi:hypothetical protein